MNNNSFKNVLNKIINKVKCYYCNDNIKKNKNSKEKNNSTSSSNEKNIISINSRFLEKNEYLSFLYKSKKKERKIWSIKYNKILIQSLKLFGEDYNILKIIFTNYSEKNLLKKINIINSKNYNKKYNKNLNDKMIDSIEDKEFFFTKNKILINFSLDDFINNFSNNKYNDNSKSFDKNNNIKFEKKIFKIKFIEKKINCIFN